MTYQLIAFDMDGTLYTGAKTITDASKAAIAQALAQGKKVAISSGRVLDQLKSVMRELDGVNYAVSGNGSVVYDFKHDSYILKRSIAPEVCKAVVDACSNADVMFETFSNGHFYFDTKDLARMDHFAMGAYVNLFKDYGHAIDDVLAFTADPTQEIQKLNLHFTSTEIRDHFMDVFKQLHAHVDFSEGTSIEMTAAGVHKGSGLSALAKHLGLTMDEVIAVGDGGNDLDMIRMAGLGVAMGNAVDELKELADVIVSDNEHDGCAEAIYTYLLSGDKDSHGC